MNRLAFIMAFEQGELEDDPEAVIDGFGDLIKTGMINHLQGFYGRTARDLIQAGYLDYEGNVLSYYQD